MTINANALSGGVYTIREAARLIEVPYARVWRWIHGDPHSPGLLPLIKNDLPLVDGQVAISFINLIEALFISRFAAYGVHVQSIRAMAEEAKGFLNSEHPFASNVIFKTDGKRIFAHVQKKYGDPKLYDLQKHNWAMEPVLGRDMIAAVDYGKKGFANRWYPRKKAAPHVILNPVAAFGQPVLSDSGVPTSAIYDAYLAEGKNKEVVAKWFEIPTQRVLEAVRFEKKLAKAA